MTDQFIHCAAIQQATKKHFHITYICAHNQDHQRQLLWEVLQQNALSIQGAWCLLGDFNTILSKEGRYGGNEIVDHDIQELFNFMANYEVMEMPSSGAFFTWTNKTLWSKIDRVFINSSWHEEFDYTLAKFLPLGCLITPRSSFSSMSPQSLPLTSNSVICGAHIRIFRTSFLPIYQTPTALP